MVDRVEGVWDRIAPLDLADCASRFAAASPFPFLVLDGFLRPEFAREVCRAYPAYEDARVLSQREFQRANEYRKVQIVSTDNFPEPVRRLDEALASPELLGALTEVTGIPDLLADSQHRGGGMHLMDAGSRLNLHIDFNHIDERLHRRLNIVLYLNEEWEDEWGGALDLWDREVKHCEHVVAPVANRAVIFQTVPWSWHGVRPVLCPPERSRNTFASFYYTEAAPPEWEGRFSSTVWAYRPDEKSQKYLKARPEQIAGSIRSGLRRATKAILGRRR